MKCPWAPVAGAALLGHARDLQRLMRMPGARHLLRRGESGASTRAHVGAVAASRLRQAGNDFARSMLPSVDAGPRAAPPAAAHHVDELAVLNDTQGAHFVTLDIAR